MEVLESDSKSSFQTQPSDALSREVTQVMLRLSKTKHFEHLHSLLKAIYASETEQGEESAQVMKEHFKLILLSLGKRYAVDEVWKQEPTELRASSGFGPKMGSNQVLKREVKSSPKLGHSTPDQRPARVPSPRSDLSSARVASQSSLAMQSLHARSYEEMYSMVHFTQSDFVQVTGAATFSKAPKQRNSSERSPGPADYHSDLSKVREKSPRTVIPRGGKRFDYIQETASPGPGRYYPMHRFISK